MGLALAVPGGHGVAGAFGLDAIEQPHRTPGRARGDPEFGVEPMGMVALGVGGVLPEPGGLSYRFGQIFSEINRKSLTADRISLLNCDDGDYYQQLAPRVPLVYGAVGVRVQG